MITETCRDAMAYAPIEMKELSLEEDGSFHICVHMITIGINRVVY